MITGHIMGKDGCLRTNVQTIPSTHLWMSSAQNQNLQFYDSTQALD
jgi:hypothetical protein